MLGHQLNCQQLKFQERGYFIWSERQVRACAASENGAKRSLSLPASYTACWSNKNEMTHGNRRFNALPIQSPQGKRELIQLSLQESLNSPPSQRRRDANGKDKTQQESAQMPAPPIPKLALPIKRKSRPKVRCLESPYKHDSAWFGWGPVATNKEKEPPSSPMCPTPRGVALALFERTKWEFWENLGWNDPSDSV